MSAPTGVKARDGILSCQYYYSISTGYGDVRRAACEFYFKFLRQRQAPANPRCCAQLGHTLCPATSQVLHRISTAAAGPWVEFVPRPAGDLKSP